MEDVPIPAYGADDVLVRVKACAVDQFDLTIRDGKFPTAEIPIVLGHEIAGEVVEVGASVEHVVPGDRVVSTPYITCGRCRFCRGGRETICEDFKGYVGIHSPGAYAEYTTLPAVNLVTLPAEISYAEGSVIANAIGTPYHAFTRRARLQPGERVLITGAGGGVGVHAVQLARMMGASVMAVDIGFEKLGLAKELGAELVCDASTDDFSELAMEWTAGKGVEVVLELVGTATFDQSFQSLGRGGRMVIVGSHSGRELHASPQLMIRYEWEVLGSRNVSKTELAEVADLVARGKIKPIVTESYALAEAEEAHQKLRSGAVIGRVVLTP